MGADENKTTKDAASRSKDRLAGLSEPAASAGWLGAGGGPATRSALAELQAAVRSQRVVVVRLARGISLVTLAAVLGAVVLHAGVTAGVAAALWQGGLRTAGTGAAVGAGAGIGQGATADSGGDLMVVRPGGPASIAADDGPDAALAAISQTNFRAMPRSHRPILSQPPVSLSGLPDQAPARAAEALLGATALAGVPAGALGTPQAGGSQRAKRGVGSALAGSGTGAGTGGDAGGGADDGSAAGYGTGRGPSAANLERPTILQWGTPEVPLSLQYAAHDKQTVFDVLVEPDGTVASITITRSCGVAELDAVYQAALRKCVFNPAYHAGNPVAAHTEVVYSSN